LLDLAQGILQLLLQGIDDPVLLRGFEAIGLIGVFVGLGDLGCDQFGRAFLDRQLDFAHLLIKLSLLADRLFLGALRFGELLFLGLESRSEFLAFLIVLGELLIVLVLGLFGLGLGDLGPPLLDKLG